MGDTLKKRIERDVLKCAAALPDIGDSGVRKLPERQMYSIENGRIVVKSMLCEFEVALLYTLAKNYFKNAGHIIDAGCLYGISTHCFARGLRKKRRFGLGVFERLFGLRGSSAGADIKSIYSFDLFKIDGPYSVFSGDYFSEGPTQNALPIFLEINKNHLDIINPHQGDFCDWEWSPEFAVEIIFNDISKSVELNNHIVRQCFSQLIPGGLVIQQDYVHFAEWWVAATMEYYREDFDELGYYFGATKLFQVKNGGLKGAADFDLRDFSYSTIERLLISAMERSPITVSKALRTALGMFYVDCGKHDLALQTVMPMKLGEEIMAELINADIPAHENFAIALPANRRNVINKAKNKLPTARSWRPTT